MPVLIGFAGNAVKCLKRGIEMSDKKVGYGLLVLSLFLIIIMHIYQTNLQKINLQESIEYDKKIMSYARISGYMTGCTDAINDIIKLQNEKNITIFDLEKENPIITYCWNKDKNKLIY